MAPNKILEANRLVNKGVTLIDHGKSVQGETYHEENRTSLNDYRQLSDPQA